MIEIKRNFVAKKIKANFAALFKSFEVLYLEA